jgi:hypothetical protein
LGSRGSYGTSGLEMVFAIILGVGRGDSLGRVHAGDKQLEVLW